MRNVHAAALIFSLVAGAPSAAGATTYTTFENWERLTFFQGQPNPNFRIYSAAEFRSAIPEWSVNTDFLSSYGVEHQHSLLTWGQQGTNDDYLEIDAILGGNVPQVLTSFTPAATEELVDVTLQFNAAGRPDLRDTRDLVVFGRTNTGVWQELFDVAIRGGSSIFPVFSGYAFSFAFDDPSNSIFQIGFGCRGCERAPGAGYLLGDVRISYNTQGIPVTPPGPAVPEPASVALFGAAIAGAFSARKHRAQKA